MTFPYYRFFGSRGSLEVDYDDMASQYETPFYLYSEKAIRLACRDFRKLMQPFDHRLYYAVKANTNHTILGVIFSEGFGADVVSVGELKRCLQAGAKPQNIVFSGVGKRDPKSRLRLN